ncbi:UNVERIFIED_CONTAM: hypothetical protein GTU68_023588, partial [Idotea baltica]|nr:hypothetical protein [Idotea baltica]
FDRISNFACCPKQPENILLDCDDEYARIKLTDFGLSKLTNDASKMTSLVGTPTYIAPEFLMDEEGRFYNSKVDMWSLGVVLFVCLAGYAPFNGKTDVETRINIKKAKFSMRKPCWSEVSSEAKDLVTKLLVLDPKNRLSAEQVLQHPWLDDPVMMKRAHKLMKLPLQMSPPKRALDEDTFDGAKKSKKKLNGIGSSEAEGSEYPKIMSGLDFESTDEK